MQNRVDRCMLSPFGEPCFRVNGTPHIYKISVS
jgi:hypothetical protein